MKRLSEIAVSADYIQRMVAAGKIKLAAPLSEAEKIALLHHSKGANKKPKITVDKSTAL